MEINLCAYGDSCLFDTNSEFFVSPEGLNIVRGEIEIQVIEGKFPNCKEKKVGEFRFSAYNLTNTVSLEEKTLKKADSGHHLFYLLDGETEDCNTYYDAFEKSFNKWRKNKKNDVFLENMLCDNNKYLITFDRLFVEPEYRKNGIGNFICKNLFNIILSFYHINPAFVVGVINPDDGTEETKEIQCMTFKNNGFDIFKTDDTTCMFKCVYDAETLDIGYMNF